MLLMLTMYEDGDDTNAYDDAADASKESYTDYVYSE